MLSKSKLNQAPIADIREMAKGFNIENHETLPKKELVVLILKAEAEKEVNEVPKIRKNDLQAILNGKLLQQFNVSGKDTTTIARFFARFGGLAESSKDELLIKINGHEINYFKIRSKLNRLISTNFLQFTHNAVYNSETKKFVNENDEAVKLATKIIRENVAISYETMNNFLTMDVADFRKALQGDEIFADSISNIDSDTKKLLAWEA